MINVFVIFLIPFDFNKSLRPYVAQTHALMHSNSNRNVINGHVGQDLSSQDCILSALGAGAQVSVVLCRGSADKLSGLC